VTSSTLGEDPAGGTIDGLPAARSGEPPLPLLPRPAPPPRLLRHAAPRRLSLTLEFNGQGLTTMATHYPELFQASRTIMRTRPRS
jgi:hypothetical protein